MFRIAMLVFLGVKIPEKSLSKSLKALHSLHALVGAPGAVDDLGWMFQPDVFFLGETKQPLFATWTFFHQLEGPLKTGISSCLKKNGTNSDGFQVHE